MKKFLLLISLFVAVGLALTASTSETSTLTNYNKQPVLVELFTSESCLSCPPAEVMLGKLEREQPFEKAELITLEFHVDYRDGFGREDKLALPLFTQRQKVYDRKFRTGKIYTPQMVVDGNIEFIGTKFDRAKKAVSKSVKYNKARIELLYEKERLDVKISGMPEHQDATVYLAIAEDGLTTRGRKGKNASNVSVVRRLNGLGRIMPNENSYKINSYVQIDPSWKTDNLKLVVFIQENSSRKIRGVGRISLKSTNEDRKS